MKSYFKLIGIIALFWFAFFTAQQVILLAFTYSLWQTVPFFQVISSFAYAFGMNISAIAYLLVFPVLIVIGCIGFRKEKLIRPVIFIYMLVATIINIILCTADIGLLHAWGSKVNSKALYYLLFPRTALATVEGSFNTLLVFVWLIETVIAIWLLRRMFRKCEVVRTGHWAVWMLAFVVTMAIILAGIRGGLQDRPINRSWVYYSKYPVLNSAAMNSFWNLLDVFFYMESKENPYEFFDDATTHQMVNQIFEDTTPTRQFLFEKEYPNIVLVLLESWSADAVGCLSGEPGITPGFDSLATQGILFTDFYSSGFRTEQGLIALLCGFPAQPQSTIIRKFGKFEHLENLVKILASNDYQSSYYYSGDLDFANSETFLKVSGFDIIYGEKNFKAKRRTRWGAYDEELFKFHHNDSLQRKEPFFSVIMTSTSHEPFTGDVDPVKKPVDEPSCYLNTVHYTDSCLYDYIIKSSSSGWFKNTLFIITADHAHYNPYNRSYNSPERHHIPMLFFGDVIKKDFRGTRIKETGYHPDIPVTLCKQLGLDGQKFEWGTDLFVPNNTHYAFYTFDNGFGLVQDTSFIVYDHNRKEVILGKGTISQQAGLTQKGKALLQLVVQRYIDLDQ